MKQMKRQWTNHIKIIGGQWRGRKLYFPDILGLRPTSNRVRETLFNWLAPVIHGAYCLDCFSGSGCLGLEALSRTAHRVILLEKNRIISKYLTKNLQLLSTLQGQVITTDSLRWLTKPGLIFNIVFIDPPFGYGLVDQTISLLEQYNRLTDHSWIYIENEIYSNPPRVPINWQLYRSQSTQQVAYRLYFRYSIDK